MARDRARRPATTRLPPDDDAAHRADSRHREPESRLRRALIALTPFSLGVAAALPRHGPASAAALEDDDRTAQRKHHTAHERAYYDRARF